MRDPIAEILFGNQQPAERVVRGRRRVPFCFLQQNQLPSSQ